MEVLIWLFSAIARNMVIKAEHGSHQKLSCFECRRQRHGADAASVRKSPNPPPLSGIHNHCFQGGRRKAVITHSCSCLGSRARSCRYPYGDGKRESETGAQLPPHEQKHLNCLIAHSCSGLMQRSNAEGIPKLPKKSGQQWRRAMKVKLSY